MRYRAQMHTRDLSRRAFLSMTAAAPLALSTGLKGAYQQIPVGLELYSVRGDLVKDLLGTVAAVGKMGYQVVEFYSPYMQWTPEGAKDVRKVLDDSGLKCLSTHNDAKSLTPAQLPKAIELNQIIGSRNIIVASAPAKTIDDWKGFAAQLSQAAEQLRASEMATGFHNHAVEFRPIDGKRPIDILAENTPKHVVLQFDVGNALEAGADPVAFIRANPGRIKSAHIKDWSPDRGYNVALGEGIAPWKAILDALEKTGGIEYYLIEQETGAQQDGEMAMVQRCLANFKKMGR